MSGSSIDTRRILYLLLEQKQVPVTGPERSPDCRHPNAKSGHGADTFCLFTPEAPTAFCAAKDAMYLVPSTSQVHVLCTDLVPEG